MKTLLIGVGGSIASVPAVVAVAAVAAAPRGTDGGHRISMEDGARAMQAAGEAMQRHGATMAQNGGDAGDPQLVALSEHWRADGQAVIQDGRWMVMSPTAPGNLLTAPGTLAAQESWGELVRTAATMVHDPGRARALDLDALTWNGAGMQDEGRAMAAHARHGRGDRRDGGPAPCRARRRGRAAGRDGAGRRRGRPPGRHRPHDG